MTLMLPLLPLLLLPLLVCVVCVVCVRPRLCGGMALLLASTSARRPARMAAAQLMDVEAALFVHFKALLVRAISMSQPRFRALAVSSTVV